MLDHSEEGVWWLHPIFTIESFTLDATPSKCATQMPRQPLFSRSVHHWLPWISRTQSHYILEKSIFIPPLVPWGHPLTLVTQSVPLVALSDIHILSYTPRWSHTEGWRRKTPTDEPWNGSLEGNGLLNFYLPHPLQPSFSSACSGFLVIIGSLPLKSSPVMEEN